MKKRIAIMAAVLLCVCMICALPAAAATKTSGTCGEGVTWSYDETTQTLTFSGVGEMDNGDLGDLVPWEELCEQILYIVIEDGITSICDYAFEGTTQLKGISIPDSVTSIGESAFERSSLTQIELHDGITYIGRSAFEWSGLEEVTVPAGVQELHFGVFRKCGNLKSAALPEGLTTIDGDAFSDCTALQSIIIPDSVTVMEDAFVRCSALEQITLGKSVTYISKSCFQDCTALREISIPDSVKAIYSWAFQNCTSLEKVTIGAGVEEISANAFWGCSTLRTFDVSSQNPVFSSDSAGVIYSKDQTQLVRFPAGFEGHYSVLDGTQMICREAGYECLELTGLTIPDSVTEIERCAFMGCRSIKSLELGNGLTYIHAEAFRECSSLESITFPASLTRLDNLAFGFCAGLHTMEFLGSFPYFESSVFADVEADAFYPMLDTTWEADLPDVSTQIFWQPVCSGEHTFVDSEAVPPTCEIPGQTGSTYCCICGYVSVYPAEVPATGHSFSFWEHISPEGTPTKERLVSRTCSACNYEETEYAYKVGLVEMPEETTPGTQPTTPGAKEPIHFSGVQIVIIVIAAVAVCFLGVEAYLLLKKKKAKLK